MSLPFENNEEKNIKKYSCFCCGVQFTDFEEFREHILEEHEEGRDYVICPFEHCKAPVRDLQLHCKFIHKNLPTPKCAQMKAMIWKDFSNGKSKTKKPKFRQGWHESTKTNTKFQYRSGYEKKVYEYLDQWVEVAYYEAEPFEIPYIHKGQGHKYIPDILVHFIDGHKEVFEIKPANQTAMEKNQDKWYAAKQACDARGWKFVVITEVGIEKLKKLVETQSFKQN